MYEEFHGYLEPKRRDGGLGWFVFGTIAGAIAMYVLDPDHGRRRRALIRDQVISLRNSADALVSEEIPRRMDYLGGFAHGATHTVKESLLGGEKPAESDQMLVARVMSTVFRDPDMKQGSVNVDANGRVVTLRGYVADSELAAEIERRVRAVDDVRDVINLINQSASDSADTVHEQT